MYGPVVVSLLLQKSLCSMFLHVDVHVRDQAAGTCLIRDSISLATFALVDSLRLLALIQRCSDCDGPGYMIVVAWDIWLFFLDSAPRH